MECVVLERVQIENYGPFNEVDVAIKPVTWLIGKKNTGKGLFVQVLRILAESLASWPSYNLFRDRGLVRGWLEDGTQVRERTAVVGSPAHGARADRPHVVRERHDGEHWGATVCPRAFSLLPMHLPENGEHPSELDAVARRFGELRCTGNVVVTTYSPHMLDHANIDRDQVLVFRKAEDGSKTITPIDVQRVDRFLDGGMFKLGEVWFNQGEDEMV